MREDAAAAVMNAIAMQETASVGLVSATDMLSTGHCSSRVAARMHAHKPHCQLAVHQLWHGRACHHQLLDTACAKLTLQT
jgi:hypothetical protein